MIEPPLSSSAMHEGGDNGVTGFVMMESDPVNP